MDIKLYTFKYHERYFAAVHKGKSNLQACLEDKIRNMGISIDGIHKIENLQQISLNTADYDVLRYLDRFELEDIIHYLQEEVNNSEY